MTSKSPSLQPSFPPAVVVAGLRGGTGKTLVTLALALAARERGIGVRAFKKGPDYIDAAWLAWATGHPCRNLDTFLMQPAGAAASFTRHALPRGLNIVEGNRGLYDGLDAMGTCSTAELAKLLGAPVVLVIDVAKVTRTVAAFVRGAEALDREVRIAGVILNRVAGTRHERILRQSIETACGVPVVGAIAASTQTEIVPERRTGLVPPAEHGALGAIARDIVERVSRGIDIDRVFALGSDFSREARGAGEAARTGSWKDARPADAVVDRHWPSPSPDLRDDSNADDRPIIGYVADASLALYYPDNLEALEAEGARVVPVHLLADDPLPPELDALYGGGFFQAAALPHISRSRRFLSSLAGRAGEGMPVYFEGEALLLLARTVRAARAGAGEDSGEESSWEMSGILQIEAFIEHVPQGHGYVEMAIETPNPFFLRGTVLRGHEFHYSRVAVVRPGSSFAGRLVRGKGIDGRDGIVAGSVWASYMQLHALGSPEWAAGVVAAARAYRSRKAGRRDAGRLR